MSTFATEVIDVAVSSTELFLYLFHLLFSGLTTASEPARGYHRVALVVYHVISLHTCTKTTTLGSFACVILTLCSLIHHVLFLHLHRNRPSIITKYNVGTVELRYCCLALITQRHSSYWHHRSSDQYACVTQLVLFSHYCNAYAYRQETCRCCSHRMAIRPLWDSVAAKVLLLVYICTVEDNGQWMCCYSCNRDEDKEISEYMYKDSEAVKLLLFVYTHAQNTHTFGISLARLCYMMC